MVLDSKEKRIRKGGASIALADSSLLWYYLGVRPTPGNRRPKEASPGLERLF